MNWHQCGGVVIEGTKGTIPCAKCKPVVVIDPEDREQVERLVNAYEGTMRGDFVAEMQHALREFANPTPPKPEEPTGRYAVVEDSDGQEWCRIDLSNGYAWQKLGQPATQYHYDMYRNIDAVKVLTPGVTE